MIENLIAFERKIADLWEAGKIRGPIHLSGGNEKNLVEIFEKVKSEDWVFSTWRSHYHALLKGIDPSWLENEILDGRSITIVNKEHKFYSSAIVGGIIPIAVGVAMQLKADNSADKVWCFVGDMAFETGGFYEMHKYATNNNLPIQFVVEDNGVSTNTPTFETWNSKKPVPDNVIYYKYKNSGRTTEQENG